MSLYYLVNKAYAINNYDSVDAYCLTPDKEKRFFSKVIEVLKEQTRVNKLVFLHTVYPHTINKRNAEILSFDIFYFLLK